MAGPRILLSVGDVSGDAIAAELVGALRARHPDWRYAGLAGPEMRAAGVEAVADAESLAVGGFAELLPSAPRIVATWRRMVGHVREARPDVAVLIDAGGFNLSFARAIRRRGPTRILYYVPPQVWAWRPRRLRTLVDRTDRIATILPNEAAFYTKAGAAVDFVGHPILDRAVSRPPAADAQDAARRAIGVPGTAPLLGLFPGSRRNEVARHLPLQLAAARRLRDRGGATAELGCVLVRAPSIERGVVERGIAAHAGGMPVTVTDAAIEGIDACDVALAKPGTITLELALRERPMVVMGRTSRLSAEIARRSLAVSWFALPNLILGEAVVPERIQSDAEPDRLADALAPLFAEQGASPVAGEGVSFDAREEASLDALKEASPVARAQREAFRRLRERLGPPGASERAADLVEDLVGTDRT